MTQQFDFTSSAIGGGVWFAGIVLAKGFWWTTCAVLVPPYAGYLVLLKLTGWSL